MMERNAGELGRAVFNPGFISVMDGAENIRRLIETTSNRTMNSIPELGHTILNFIGGKWEPSATDKWTDRHDPADQSILVARAPDSSGDDASRAIEAASKASTEWNALAAPRRGRLLFE